MGKLAVFVDNDALFRALHEMGRSWRFDYKRLRDYLLLQRKSVVLRIYCGEVRDDPPRRRKFYEVLQRSGFEVVRSYQERSRAANAAFDSLGREKLHVLLGFDLADQYHRCHYDHLLLVACDVCLRKPVKELRHRGVRIELVFFDDLCEDLRKCADEFRSLRRDGLGLDEVRT